MSYGKGTGEAYLSAITIAFMEDTGHYVAVNGSGGAMVGGRSQDVHAACTPHPHPPLPLRRDAFTVCVVPRGPAGVRCSLVCQLYDLTITGPCGDVGSTTTIDFVFGNYQTQSVSVALSACCP